MFWRHLASYLKALVDNAGTEATQRWAKENFRHWIYRLAEQELVDRYAQQIKKDEPWRFTGFVFPAMDISHTFSRFPFPAVNFNDARFSGDADFRWAQFSGEAVFQMGKV